MSSMTSTQSSRPAARSSATASSENTRARDSGMINLFLKAYFRISVWINWRGPTTIISYLTKIQSWSRAGSSTRSTGASQQPSAERSANSLRLDGRTIHFSINAWVWNDYLPKQSSYVWLKASRPLIRVLVINDNGLWINEFIWDNEYRLIHEWKRFGCERMEFWRW